MRLINIRFRNLSQPLQNENGTAIITALLILMLLTLVSLTATETTTTEKRIVRSETVFQQNFYLAESAAMEGVQRIIDTPTEEQLLPSLIPAADPNIDLIVNPDQENPDDDLLNLDTNNDTVFDQNDTYEVSEIDPTTYRVVILNKIPAGSSIGIGAGSSSRLYDYASYGYSEAGNGQVFVKIGIKKRI